MEYLRGLKHTIDLAQMLMVTARTEINSKRINFAIALMMISTEFFDYNHRLLSAVDARRAERARVLVPAREDSGQSSVEYQKATIFVTPHTQARFQFQWVRLFGSRWTKKSKKLPSKN